MAGRRPLAIGELGAVSFTVTRGRLTGRARTRNAGGALVRIAATADTEDEVRERLSAQASKLALKVESVTEGTIMSTLFSMWISDRAGAVRPQSLRIYKDTVSWLSPIVGGLPVGDMRPARVKAVLSAVEQGRSSAAVHAARVALNGAFGIAVELDAIDNNPIRSLRRQKPKRRMPKALNVDQVSVLRQVILDRERTVAQHGGAQGAPLLRWVVELMLGTGLRISEVMALRNMDVDLRDGTIAVTGTMIEDEKWILVRQDELKSRDQSRKLLIPRYAQDVLHEARRNADSLVSRLPDAPALPGRRGNVISPRGIRRALRKVRADERVVTALSATGLVPEDLTPHALRRTAATLVAAATGDIQAAQHLLGHANIETTKQWYVGLAFKHVGSAMVLDEILGDRLTAQ